MCNPIRRFFPRMDFWTVITGIAILLFLFFLVYPLFSLFASSFKDSETGRLTLAHYIQFLSKKYYYQTLFNSLKITVFVTILAILVGAPLAYLMSSFKIHGKKILEVLIIISLLSPPFIGAYSWILLLGRSGVVTRLLEDVGIHFPSIYGFPGILLAFTLKLFPFIYLYVNGALKKIDASLGEAAESLGCSGIRKVYTVIYPLILPTMFAGALLVFMNALADFGTPMLIGEGFRVMPVLIYSEFISEVGGEANFAAALSVIVVLLTMGIFSLQKYIVNRKSFTMSSMRPISPKKVTGARNLFAHMYVYVIVFLAIIPQLTVVYTSFLKTRGSRFEGGFSLDSYEAVFSRLSNEVTNTFLYGFIAIVIIVLLGMFVSYVSVRRRNIVTDGLDTLVMVPYIIPGSVMGLTLLFAFNKAPLILSGTAAIIIAAYVIRRLPYTVRSSAAILYQLSPSLEEASISLGYSHVKTFFKVTAIMMLPGVIAGAVLSWITVITELSASVILYTGMTKTMSVAVYTEVIRASYGTAAALSTILTLTTVISLLLFFKLTGRRDISL